MRYLLLLLSIFAALNAVEYKPLVLGADGKTRQFPDGEQLRTVPTYGPDAAKPAAATANTGMIYCATDTQKIYRSTGSAWVVMAIGALTPQPIGSTPNGDGLTITGSNINLEPASASFGGIVTTGTQTIAGDKTFTGEQKIERATAPEIAISTKIAAEGESRFRILVNGLMGWGDGTSFDALFYRESAGALRTEGALKVGTAASAQDTIRLLGRSGGTSNYSATITPPTLTASRTITLPDADTALPGLNINNTFTGTITSSNLSGTNTGDQTITLTGNVTGSGTGSFAATIANDAVTNAKMANVATQTFKGRTTAATGDPEDLTIAQAKTMLNLTGTNSGDVTLSAIGGTPNANGATLTGQALNLQPASASFGGVVTTGAQTFAGAKTFSSVITGPAATTGTATFNAPHGTAPTSPVNGDLWTTTAGVFSRVNGATSSFSGTNSGDQTITLTGDVTGSGTSSFAATVSTNVITNTKLADVPTATFKGRTTAATGDPEDLTVAQATAMLDTVTTTLKGLAPASGGGTANFLRADLTWAAPPAGGISGTLTSGRVPYATGTSTVVDSAKMVYDNTTGFNVNLASSGANNLTLGTGAGDSLSTGNNNVFIGNNAGTAITTSNQMVVIGSTAGDTLTGGTGAVIIGFNAAGSGTNIGSVVAIGSNALSSATNLAASNVAIGDSALLTSNAANNTGIGTLALTLVTGADNTALGFSAGANYLSQINTTSIGSNSAQRMRGTRNTAIGAYALQGSATPANNTGQGNTAIGNEAGFLITSGSSNVLIGEQSADSITSGSLNVLVGAASAPQVTTATTSIVIGSNSGGGLVNGARNVIIGTNTIATSSATDTIALGHAAEITANNQMVVGSSTSAITDIYLGEGTIDASPATVTLNATGGDGTNVSGAAFNISGGRSTGNALGGSVILRTSPAGTSGTSVNALVDRVTISSVGNLVVNTVGTGLQIKEGSNAKMGVVTLVGGASTVNNTSVTATSRILLTSQSDGGTVGFLRVSARTAATSFTITSSSGTDTSTVAWFILEPSP